MFRYAIASLITVGLGVVLLALFNGAFGLRAWLASTLATAIAALPSYQLNRRWAWGLDGRSHLWREIVPFWALALVGWAASTEAAHVAEAHAMATNMGKPERTAFIAVVWLAAIAVVWVAKFVIFNRLMFLLPAEQPALVPVPTGDEGRTRRAADRGGAQ